MKGKIIFATGNAHKIQEIRAILAETGLEILSMKEAGVTAEAEENGTTFAENALIKARAVHALAPDAIVMADDSGLEVDHLDGAPGIMSARWMGEDTSYLVKNGEILRLLEGVSGEGRSARFRCSIAVIFPDGAEEVCEGTVEGVIADAPAGENGFGYDPIFFLPEYGMTTAELPPQEKNRVSHRGRALVKAAELIRLRQRDIPG